MDRRNFLSSLAAGASASATSFEVDATEFGAVGDGTQDDAPFIQAALDKVGAQGGGSVLLPPPKRHYRLGKGLKIPSHVCLEGPAPVRYPFNAGNSGACALVATFDDPQQWVIEPKTSVSNRPLRFDETLAKSLPDGATYNCSIRNLLITSQGAVPYGGIRMHGCPGSIIQGVAIDRVGCGVLINYSFGGHYQVHVNSLYYGLIAWDDANANIFEIYSSQAHPYPKEVPDPYVMPFFRQINEHFVDTLKLESNAHRSRPYGVMCGSIASTCTGNAFDAVVERFAGGVFLYNAYATAIRQCYIEADAGVSACCIAASRSRFSVEALHAYVSGSGAIFDFGLNVAGDITCSGILHAGRFGKPPVEDGSSAITFSGLDLTIPGTPLTPSLRYSGRATPWRTLPLRGGWVHGVAPHIPFAARMDAFSHKVELRGMIIGGQPGRVTTLPTECRPTRQLRLQAAGGLVDIGADGAVTIQSEGDTMAFDGLTFGRW